MPSRRSKPAVLYRSAAFALEPIEQRLLLASIGGTVFGDFDSDGVRDANEPGLAGWTVYIDNNDNSVLDAGEPSVVSDANGAYAFTVNAGSYNIREIVPAGWQQTVPNSGGVNLRPAGELSEAALGIDTSMPYTQTEVLARVRNLRGLRELDRHLIANPASRLHGLLDLQRSAQMFKLNGGSLVEVRLRPGANPVDAIAELRKLPIIEWAHPNYIYQGDPRELIPNDPSFGSQAYHFPQMQNTLAWDTTLGDPRITIGVTDDGIMMHHPDLYQNIWVNPAEIPPTRLANLTDLNGDGYISMVELNDPLNIGLFKANDVNGDARIDYRDLLAPMGGGGTDDGTGGWADGIDQGTNGFVDDIVGRDFWQNDSDSNPAVSGDDHGTHVAGIAAARTNNGVGVAGTAGAATIVPIRFYSTAGGNTWTAALTAAAYAYAADNGVRILTTSYNVDNFSTQAAFIAGLDYMYSKGVLHFNSAGNNGALNPTRQRHDHTLFVANVQTSPMDVRNSSSNYGWGIDISAPGTNIFNTAIGSGTFPNYVPSYESKSGTSMAAPNAAGVAALIWSKNPRWTREMVAAQLLATADNIDPVNPSIAGLLGAGRVNSFRAVTENIAPPKFKNNTLTGLPAEGAQTATPPTVFTFDANRVFNPATVTASSFEIRGAGLDGMFNTADDSFVPFTLSFGDAAAPSTQYKVGTNRFRITITGGMGADTFRFSALPTLTDPFGQPLDGNGDGIGGDAFTRTFRIINRTNRYRVTVTQTQVVDNADFGNRETIRPSVVGSMFLFEATHAIRFAFSEDVGSSIAGSDLVLTNITTSQVIPAAHLAATYLPATNRAVFTYTGSANGALPDGNYTALLPAENVADNYGNTLDAPGQLSFFVLAGDADRDRSVNLSDFSILAANFNQTGTYSAGDFNYNGSVELGDFAILAANFNTDLSVPRKVSPAAAAPTATPPTSPFASARIESLLSAEEQDQPVLGGAI